MTSGDALPTLRPLDANDALALQRFYNGLSEASIRTFRPLGLQATLEKCEQVVADNATPTPTRFDWVASERDAQDAIVGWAFIRHLNGDQPEFGLAVADRWQGRGVGTRLIAQVMAHARDLGMSAVYLIVVQDNARAIRMYQRHGFAIYGEIFDEKDQLHYFQMVAHLRGDNADSST